MEVVGGVQDLLVGDGFSFLRSLAANAALSPCILFGGHGGISFSLILGKFDCQGCML